MRRDREGRRCPTLAAMGDSAWLNAHGSYSQPRCCWSPPSMGCGSIGRMLPAWRRTCYCWLARCCTCFTAMAATDGIATTEGKCVDDQAAQRAGPAGHIEADRGEAERDQRLFNGPIAPQRRAEGAPQIVPIVRHAFEIEVLFVAKGPRQTRPRHAGGLLNHVQGCAGKAMAPEQRQRSIKRDIGIKPQRPSQFLSRFRRFAHMRSFYACWTTMQRRSRRACHCRCSGQAGG
jgi:hypothetical protein